MKSPSRSYSGLLDFRAFDPNVFERQALPFDEIGDVVAERRNILQDVFFGLFKRHEDAARRGPRHERGIRARTSSCHNRDRRRQASAGLGQAAAGDLVEAGDSGGDLLER